MMIKRMAKLSVAIIVLLAILSGCGGKRNGTQPPPAPAEPLPVPQANVVEVEDVPAFILDNHVDLTTQNYYAFQLEDTLYLLAAMGERPSSGYSISFSQYRDNQDHTWNVYLETTAPAADEPVLTVLTYPAAFARFNPDLPIFHVRFHVDGQETALVTVERLTALAEETEVFLYYGTENAYLHRETRPVSANFLTRPPEEQAEMLMTELLKGSMAQFGTARVIPAGTELRETTYQAAERLLNVTLSSSFADLAGSASEQLAVYSVVNTLTQIEGVDFVSIDIIDGELQHMDQLHNLTYNAELVATDNSI